MFFIAMYCNVSCMIGDSHELHYVTCKDRTIFEKMEGFTLRMMLRSVNIFGVKTADWHHRYDKDQLPRHSVFDLDFSDCHSSANCKNMFIAAFGGSENKRFRKALGCRFLSLHSDHDLGVEKGE
jgi:hypothetical protein